MIKSKSLQIDVFITQPEINNQIVIAFLSELPFTGFEDYEWGIRAYIESSDLKEEDLARVKNDLPFIQSLKRKHIDPVNWNAKWEAEYEKILVGKYCLIRAPFHKSDPTIPLEIIIQPQMSFGTGHHETTYLMVESMINTIFSAKSVLDMGCGTGVLAILAARLGASQITAIDVDPWAYENTLSNMKLNNLKAIDVLLGDASAIPDQRFDFIVANINKNILRRDLPIYAKHLVENGKLLLSGFFATDVEDLKVELSRLEMTILKKSLKNNWAMLLITTNSAEL